MDRMRLAGEQGNEAGVGVLDGGAGKRSDADQAALAFDDGGDAGLALAVDGVRFPVAVARAPCDDVRPILNHALSCQSAPAVVATVALAPALRGATQVGPEVAAAILVLPDPEVDRLVAHDGPAESAQSPDDLFRTPAAPQQSNDECEVLRPEAGIAPGAAAPSARHLHREGRSVGSVVRRGVATQLPVDRAPVPPQYRRNLRVREAGLPQCR